MLRGQKLCNDELVRLGTHGIQSSILRVRRKPPDSVFVQDTPPDPQSVVSSPSDVVDETNTQHGLVESDCVDTITRTVVQGLVEEVVGAAALGDEPPRTVTIREVLDGMSVSNSEQTTILLCDALNTNPECMDTLKVIELRALCTHLALSTGGKKSDIKSRIIAYHRKLTTDA